MGGQCLAVHDLSQPMAACGAIATCSELERPSRLKQPCIVCHMAGCHQRTGAADLMLGFPQTHRFSCYPARACPDWAVTVAGAACVHSCMAAFYYQCHCESFRSGIKQHVLVWNWWKLFILSCACLWTLLPALLAVGRLPPGQMQWGAVDSWWYGCNTCWTS